MAPDITYARSITSEESGELQARRRSRKRRASADYRSRKARQAGNSLDDTRATAG
jgi:hypothetical protein